MERGTLPTPPRPCHPCGTGRGPGRKEADQVLTCAIMYVWSVVQGACLSHSLLYPRYPAGAASDLGRCRSHVFGE